ncbi:protein terminal ear1 homolog [Mercurialis annua]|uniref:protein terminal ear1 homolog n=1 Tax=Mercurialis annua TaxID=3986 RepID=UPI00215FA29A|nr:protein terminal ear1 homolog [Mercurialis annua]
MAEAGYSRFPGSLDPRAQEFRPTSHHLHHQQLQIFSLPPPPQLYYPYTPPHTLGFLTPAPPPPPQPYVNIPTATLVQPPLSAAPTRTLILTSVPREVSESIIRRELEVFGAVRGVQMERIYDGIVTVHFYDLRHAEIALKEIRDKHILHQTRLTTLHSPPPPQQPPYQAARGLITGCAIWAQFVIPSYKAVPDGYNHGTIVIFNLDPNVSISYLKEIFQAFGEVKELRETPLKKQQKFVEFYDIRDAAKALKEMNGKEINGKQIVIEFSRPGGYGRKFFNAHTSINTVNNTFKLSKYAPPPSPSQPPSNLIKGNPNNESNKEVCSVEALIGDVHGSTKRSCNSKKTQNIESTAGSIAGSNTVASKQQSRSRPWKSRPVKKFDTRFLINEEAMVDSNCSDSRTTVMIKNIPNKYSQKLLLNMLDNHCIHCNEQIIAGGGGEEDQPLSCYDFVYLPIDFNNKCNVGYGFVNMTSPEATLRLYKAFHHQHWEVFNSRKICEVTYARVQGLEALKEHFKNSKFPCEMDHYLPVIFAPPRDGKQLTDPQPVIGHAQKQQQKQHSFITATVSSGDTDQEDQEHSSSNYSSSSQNGGDDEKDSSSGSLV